NYIANLAYSGRFEEARARADEALALLRGELPPSHPLFGQVRLAQGITAWRQGAYAEAESELRDALGISTKALGPTHPRVAFAELGLGDALVGLGRGGEARHLYERALRTFERLHDESQIADALTGIAVVLLRRGDARPALGPLERALAI